MVYFHDNVAIWYLYCHFGIFYGHFGIFVAVWVYFCRCLGIFFHFGLLNEKIWQACI
jgi:hypothetical protein